MRRKEDDKRVLIPRNNRPPAQGRRRQRNRRARNGNYKKRKTNGITLFLMILALVAFVIGAGIGVSLSLDDGSNEGPQYENVTKEMTTNLNDTDQVYYDEELDHVDFNDNQTLEEFNVTDEPSY